MILASIYKAESYRVMGFILCTPTGQFILNIFRRELVLSNLLDLSLFISSFILSYIGLSLIQSGEEILLELSAMKRDESCLI